MKTILMGVFLAILALSAPAYCSDFDFGSTARATAMGGAGLALGDDSGTSGITNPAGPAVMGTKFRFMMPGFDFHVRGTTVGKLIDAASTVNNLNDSGALDLVNDFAKQPTSLTLSSMVGFTGQVGFTIEGEASANILPSVAAQEWANIGQGFRTGIMNLSAAFPYSTDTNLRNTVTLAKAGNITGANAAFASYTNELSQTFVQGNLVVALPAVQLSAPLESESGKWYVGTNIKLMRIESRSWQVVASGAGSNPVAVDSHGNVLAAATFDTIAQPTQKHTSLKVDAGAIYAPHNNMFQYGIVINNLIKPREVGLGLNQADTMVSVGVAAHPISGLTLAADLINLTQANDADRDLRVGAEWAFGRLFAVRAGYAGQGISWGVGVFGLNLAFAPKTARLLTDILRF